MPSYLRGIERDQAVAVKVYKPQINTYYGFKSKRIEAIDNLNASDVAALGHLPFSSLPDGALIFFRATAPKPPRCRKVLRRNPAVNQQGSASTFYSVGRERQVIAAGWDLSTGAKSVNLKTKRRYITAIAEMDNGALYCFPLNRNDFDTYAGALGLKAPSAIRNDTDRGSLVMGASRPRPAVAAKDLPDGSSFSSFVSDSAINNLAQADFYQVEGAIRS